MTGHGDISMSVRAMKRARSISSPSRFAIRTCSTRSRQRSIAIHKRRDSEKVVTDTGALFDRLSPREREIMTLVTSELMNKQLAAETGLAEIRVKIHRGHEEDGRPIVG
jgi:FixJ family two-component response regulator